MSTNQFQIHIPLQISLPSKKTKKKEMKDVCRRAWRGRNTGERRVGNTTWRDVLSVDHDVITLASVLPCTHSSLLSFKTTFVSKAQGRDKDIETRDSGDSYYAYFLVIAPPHTP